MDFSAFWRTGFYAVRDIDEGNFGTKCIRGVFANSRKHMSINNNYIHSHRCYLFLIINACFNITWCLNKVFQRLCIKN